MQPVNRFVPEYTRSGNDYGYDFSPYGEVVHQEDCSESYDVDEAVLIKDKDKHRRAFTVLFAQGCSCWSGDYEGWTNLSKAELKKLAETWAKPTPEEYQYKYAEATLGRWIKKNWRTI